MKNRGDMATWALLPDGEAARQWDEKLLGAKDYTVFQSYGWGELKRLGGWRPLRWICRNGGGRIASMVQLLVKTLPFGFAVGWAPGGPAILFEGRGGIRADCDLSGLFAALRTHVPRVLVRLDSYIPREPELAYIFNQACRRPCARISSGFSIQFDLSDRDGAFVDRMVSKHRYYVRRAEAASLRWEAGCADRDIAALAALHREMTVSKGLKTESMSERQYVALRDALGPDGMTVLTGYLDDRPVTSCLTLDFGKKSFYFVAATGQAGRQVGAAYAMLPRLIEVLQKKGIEHFDFGGIAPASPGAEGVDHFKRGFGGKIVEYLGEWEWASVPMLAPAIGLLMKYRGMAR